MATHYSILAWRTPWTEEPGGLQNIGSQSGHNWATNTFTFRWKTCTGQGGAEGHRPSMSAPGASASQHHDVVTSLKALRILLYAGFVQVSLHRHRSFFFFFLRHRSLPTSRGNPKHRDLYYRSILPPLLGKQHAVQLTLLICSCLLWSGASLVAPLVKNPPAIWET